MPLSLSTEELDLLGGRHGEGVALAMRILTETARLLGASELLAVNSAHIDSCLYHGDSGTLVAEHLVRLGAKVRVPTSLNVGALDLLHPGRERFDPKTREMARRLMAAYLAMGCSPTWTCAPYQAGHRPELGQDVAWGESNAVAFCNSVLGARTNRYGDFLDICAALTGRAPRIGLHIVENRRATVLIDATGLPDTFFEDDIAYPILGSWLGHAVGDAIAAFDGLPGPSEDQLKALSAAAASSGSVGLFHVIGTTPEATTRDQAFAGRAPEWVVRLDGAMMEQARCGLSNAAIRPGDKVDAVAIGSPHLSSAELRALDQQLGGQMCQIPFYACASRRSLGEVEAEGVVSRLHDRGVVLVSDTCIVVTPLLPAGTGVLVTNSGKFAHYTPANTGYDVVFASLADCIGSAVTGQLVTTRMHTT